MFEDVDASEVGAKEEDAGRGSSSHTWCPWGHCVISTSIGADGGRWERHGSEGCSVRESADDVLLGTDVPDLPELLNQGSNVRGKMANALAVVTRAQRKQQQCEEKLAQQRELESGVSSTGTEDDGWMFTIDDELFQGG